MSRTGNTRSAVKQAVRSGFIFGPFQPQVVGCDAVTPLRISKVGNDNENVHLAAWELRTLLPRLVEQDRDAAIRLVSGILDLEGAGLVLSRCVDAAATPDLHREALEAGAATGRMLDALCSGAPVQEVVERARVAVRENTEALHAAQATIPQPTLPRLGVA